VSFILDALRKSEHERQRQSGPGIADLTSANTRTGLPLWAIALGALLIINIGVVLVLVLRGEPTPPTLAPEPALQPVAPAMMPASPASQPAPALVDSGRRTETPPASPAPELDERSVAASEPEDFAEESAVEPDEFSDPELAAAVHEATKEDIADENLPTINDVTLQGSAVPELHLDIHVYATSPAGRFVFINMRKYREGDQTPEGTRIERITRDGVVLNHRGVRFLMPRQ
jgi:general secretion pathway protein B